MVWNRKITFCFWTIVFVSSSIFGYDKLYFTLIQIEIVIIYLVHYCSQSLTLLNDTLKSTFIWLQNKYMIILRSYAFIDTRTWNFLFKQIKKQFKYFIASFVKESFLLLDVHDFPFYLNINLNNKQLKINNFTYKFYVVLALVI